jgi:hypothetical protein
VLHDPTVSCRALAVTTEQEQAGRDVHLLELRAADDVAARAVVACVAGASPGSSGVLVATLPGTPLARRASAAGLLPVPRRLEDQQLHVGVVPPRRSCGRAGRSAGATSTTSRPTAGP